ncbi:YIP1 family protein [Paenibacillus koleovorans]|uniref:YIP1 family protein n=1 Tax=Paenibacillus koleovorans TaxID=121608 RepID=UPI000FDA4809|nr:YIP1 family protein [Paenibacillus koleovorans]
MTRRLRLRSAILFILAALGAASLHLPEASAQLPYSTYYKDGYGRTVQIQSAYYPDGVLGRELGTGAGSTVPLNQPLDLFADSRDQLYVADTGNNRIVQLDADGRFIREMNVRESPLSRPSGVYVTDAGDIYIADTGNHRVVRLDAEGRLVRQFGRPESSYLPASFKYEPVKVIVDKRGFLYITTLGAFQGLLQLDPEGAFQHFFGANKVAFSLFDSFKRLVYTREMYNRELSKLPGAIVNAAIDRNGFIYTVTKETKADQVKKFNIAGLNQLENRGEFASSSGGKSKSFGETAWGRSSDPQLQDITIDSHGNMTVIDAVHPTVSQYDENGNLLLFWSGGEYAGTSKLGLVKAASAIETASDGRLLILDSENSLIQRFRLTEFGRLVHEANKLTQEGRYEESEPLWREVYRLDAYYTPALVGLAKAAFKKEQYELAEELFFKAGVNQGYSDAFWHNRLVWFQEHFALLMNVAAALVIAAMLADRLSRKRAWRDRLRSALQARRELPLQLLHVRRLIAQPIDGYHAIRYEAKAGTASSLIMLGLAISAYAAILAGTSFVFNPAIYTGVRLGASIIPFVAVWGGWVVSHYLVSSLMRGEGRLRDVFQGSSYALFPIILIGIPVTLLSQVFTTSEQSIFGLLQLFLIVWTALQFFWMVQGIQNYSVGEAILNIILSLLALAIIAVLIFIFFSLSGELIDFIYSIYQEVVIR